MNDKNKQPSEILKDKLNSVNLAEGQIKSKKFDIEEFKKDAKALKKTFDNENLSTSGSSL